MAYPLPINELQRLDALRGYQILDSAPDPAFDQITTLASHLCDMPMALISFVDSDRVWFKSSCGTDKKQIPRGSSYCAHTILRSDVLMIEDATQGFETSRASLCGGVPGLRSYAGAPLISSTKLALGSLCVIDYEPRVLSRTQSRQLEMLAEQVVNQLELRRTMNRLRHQSSILQKTQQVAQIGGWEVNLDTNTLTWTDETYRIHGETRDTYLPTVASAIEWYAPSSRPIIRAAFEALVKYGTPYDLELQVIAKDGRARWIRTTAQRDHDAPHEGRLYGTFQDIHERRELEAEVVSISNRELVLIGSNLHEGLKHELSTMNFLLHDMAAKVIGHAPESSAYIERLSRSIRDAVDTCNTLTHGSFPSGRERGGLFQSLRAIGATNARVHDIKIRVRCKGQDWSFDSYQAEHLYRIAQEAITSAVKHAYAHQLFLSLCVTASHTTLSITDDGLGGFGSAYLEGNGLQIIRHRARLIGAILQIHSTKRGGTRIYCRLSSAGGGDLTQGERAL